MSGGNHLWISRLAGVACAITIGAAVSAIASSQSEPAFAVGIATANIAWATPETVATTFTEIAAAGFNSIRIGLKDPLDGTYRALEQAKEAGLNVLVTIPLVDGAIAASGAKPRPRNGRFFAVYGLSQIDPVRYRARLEKLLTFADSHMIPLIGLELGNELNWSGYNGDLPLSPTGTVIRANSDWHAEGRILFESGLDRYRALAGITRQVLAKYPSLHAVKLISGGLADINSQFIHSSRSTYVAPDIVYTAFTERQIFQQFDVVGIHLYEPLRKAFSLTSRAAMIGSQLEDCSEKGFADLPCWITEFGAALPPQDCAPGDSWRISVMQPLLRYLAVPANARRIPIGFYYDWNDDAGFALVRCSRPTELTKILAGYRSDEAR